jgi:hypothetical protein
MEQFAVTAKSNKITIVAEKEGGIKTFTREFIIK